MDGMDILYLLVPLSVVLVFLIAGFFWWSLRGGQFEDLEGEGFRILMDNDRTPSGGEAFSDEGQVSTAKHASKRFAHTADFTDTPGKSSH